MVVTLVTVVKEATVVTVMKVGTVVTIVTVSDSRDPTTFFTQQLFQPKTILTKKTFFHQKTLKYDKTQNSM